MLEFFKLRDITTVETRDNATFCHDEAGVTIVLEATKSGQSVSRMLSGDTNVFVLLVYWVNRTDIQCKIQDGALGWISTGHQCNHC